MNDFVRSNDEWWYHGDGLHPNMLRAILLHCWIGNRKDDCLSPLMHEFTYEAMVNDLLSIKDDMVGSPTIVSMLGPPRRAPPKRDRR